MASPFVTFSSEVLAEGGGGGIFEPDMAWYNVL